MVAVISLGARAPHGCRDILGDLTDWLFWVSRGQARGMMDGVWAVKYRTGTRKYVGGGEKRRGVEGANLFNTSDPQTFPLEYHQGFSLYLSPQSSNK